MDLKLQLKLEGRLRRRSQLQVRYSGDQCLRIALPTDRVPLCHIHYDPVALLSDRCPIE
jgi:hypothetical protein